MWNVKPWAAMHCARLDTTSKAKAQIPKAAAQAVAAAVPAVAVAAAAKTFRCSIHRGVFIGRARRHMRKSVIGPHVGIGGAAYAAENTIGHRQELLLDRKSTRLN